MTITLIPTAMRDISTARLVASDMAAEYELAATDDLLDLVPDAPVDLRTVPQVEFMNRLMAELRELDPAAAAQGDDYMHQMTMRGMWTSGREGNASRWIERLIARVRSARAAKRAAAPAAGKVELADGVYKVEGRFYMVQHAVHGSGNQYAKLIEVSEGGAVSTSYAAGMIRNIRPEHRITGEEAAAFGQVYGVCVFCVRTLTDERSKAVGYGRKCADNHGLPWG